MPKLRSIYAGGYSEEKKRRLQSYKLPPKIKCAVCHKTKAVNFFSTIQQLELQNGLATGQIENAALEGWVPCVSCTPKQVTELECCICEEIKDLDGFAKAQRRLGENARCITCVAILNGDTPVDGSYREHFKNQLGEDEDGYGSDDSCSNAHENSTFGETESNAGVSLSSGSGYDLNQENLKTLNISSDGQSSKPTASQAATSASVPATKRIRVAAGTGKWQEFAKEGGGESVESISGVEFTGFDHYGNAHQVVRPASTVVSDHSDDDTIADPREQARIAREEVCIQLDFDAED
ncbi:MAG: hypothetical protein ALECFALPRED_005474 [Alectoria fallacina]|uniref:Stc1 domain-containing protein n=1 Tax=Alectoria fallacina TaxID=1903189 RepID=A0A8H3FY00_9LECA|nr:MAG: hypothetical protein ALECFALPRED_005474 [Alectoria fallacina]